MKTYTLVALVCVLAGCEIRQPVEFFSDEGFALRGQAAPAQDEDGGVAPPDPGLDPADPDSDAGVAEPTTAPGRPQSIPAEPAPGGALRSLTLRMTGMNDELDRFAQFRVRNSRNELAAIFVIHQGLDSATYTWELPGVLVTGESYTLDFFIDHDQTSGWGAYDRPPLDHAWRVAIPAGQGDAVLDFAANADFVDIEADAPETFRSTVLASSGMGDYVGRSYDVRVTQRSDGRLVGRQLREVPGDTFDLRVSGTTQPGVEYVIDVTLGAADASQAPTRWQLIATAGEEGLRATLEAEP